MDFNMNLEKPEKCEDEVALLVKEIEDAKLQDASKLAEFQYLLWQISARGQQEQWLNKLGDRRFHFIDRKMLTNSIKPLVLKVGFALYGIPSGQGADLYKEEQTATIIKVCNKIQETNEKLNNNGVYLSIIFIPCFVEAKKAMFTKAITPATEFTDVLFVVGSSDCNKIRIIDTHLRVYETWQSFKADNKYPPCSYALPKDGMYQPGFDGSPLLEFEKSPAAQIKSTVFKVLDLGSIGLGLGTAVVSVGSIFIPVATPIVIGAAVTAIASSAYSAGRSINTLVDRHTHAQSIHIVKDPEARTAWIELVLSGVTIGVSAGSLFSTAKAASAAAKAAQAGETAAASVATAGSEAVASSITAGEQAAASIVTEAAATSNVAKSGAVAGKVSKGATKGVQTAAKAGKNLAKAGKNLGEVASKGAQVSSKSTKAAATAAKAGKNLAKAGKNLGEVASKGAQVTSKSTKAVATAAKAGKNLAKAGKNLGEVASKSAQVTSKSTKAAATAAKAGKNLAKAGKNLGEVASKSALVTSKSTKATATVAKAGKVASKSSKAAKAAARAAKSATKVTEVGGKIAETGLATQNIANAATDVSHVYSGLGRTLSSVPATAMQLVNHSSTLLMSQTFIKIVEVVLDFIFGNNACNIALKHKDMLEQTIFIIKQHFSGTLDQLQVSQFVSHAVFYFNTLIDDHRAYIDKFLCRFYETICNMGHTGTTTFQHSETSEHPNMDLVQYDGFDTLIDIMMHDISRVPIVINSEELKNNLQTTQFVPTYGSTVPCAPDLECMYSSQTCEKALPQINVETMQSSLEYGSTMPYATEFMVSSEHCTFDPYPVMTQTCKKALPQINVETMQSSLEYGSTMSYATEFMVSSEHCTFDPYPVMTQTCEKALPQINVETMQSSLYYGSTMPYATEFVVSSEHCTFDPYPVMTQTCETLPQINIQAMQNSLENSHEDNFSDTSSNSWATESEDCEFE